MRFHWRSRSRTFVKELAAAVLFILAVIAGLVIYFRSPARYSRELVMTAGSLRGLRSQVAFRLTQEARGQGLRLRIVETEGSREALQRVERGTVDLALVQGGLTPTDFPHVRQLAALHVEPLHLLVKPEIHRSVEESLSSLRGKTVNLSTRGSGTFDLAFDVLEFAGLRPRDRDGRGDYTLSTEGYREIEEQDDIAALPDAVFTVSYLPSPVVRHLVSRYRYKLVSLMFGEAFSLESFGPPEAGSNGSPREDDVARSRIYPTLVPPFTYGINPPTPPAPLPTFGPRLLLVANEAVPGRAARLLLEAVFSPEFSNFHRPPLDPSLLESSPEFPWHPGTDEFREYHKPLLAGDVIDLMEKGTSLLGAVAGALFFLWQWLRQRVRRRQELGFESYMVKVAQIEQQALNLELGAMLDLKELLRLQVELNRLKNEALHRFAEGKLEGEALMSGFVSHVNDARNYLTRLILHERENLALRAQVEKRAPEEVWAEALGQRGGPIEAERGVESIGE